MSTQDHTNTCPLLNITLQYFRAHQQINRAIRDAIDALTEYAHSRHVYVSCNQKERWRLQLLKGCDPYWIRRKIDEQVRQPDEGDFDDGIDMHDVRSDTYR